MDIKAVGILTVALTVSACQVQPRSLADLRWAEQTGGLITKEERAILARADDRERLEANRRMACIAGSRPAIDRTKLNCENVKGSPEYKAYQESLKQSEAENVTQ